MAKERCIRVCLQHGRRWERGEIREIDAFDKVGRPIVSTHFELIDLAKVDPKKEFKTPDKAALDKSIDLRGDRSFAIRKALEALNPEDDTNWTVRGHPALPALFAKLGFEVQRGDVLEAWPEFDRELARANRKG